MEYLKINNTCIEQLLGLEELLYDIEVKGDSLVKTYRALVTLRGVLEQINEDNKEQESKEEVKDG